MAKSTDAAPTTSGASKKTRKVASNKQSDVLDDARQLEKTARAQLPSFVAADKDKTKKRVTKQLLDQLKANIAAVLPASAKQSGHAIKQKSATGTEEGARAALFAALTSIRDEVKTTFPGDKVVAKAFGTGAKIAPKSTPGLLAAADSVLAAVDADASLKKKASDAGIKAAAFTGLKKLRAALADAQENQVSAIAERRSSGASKLKAMAAVTKDVAYVRQVASVVFKGDKEKLALFATRRPKHTSKPKPKPSSS